jgi:hypothetical protein
VLSAQRSRTRKLAPSSLEKNLVEEFVGLNSLQVKTRFGELAAPGDRRTRFLPNRILERRGNVKNSASALPSGP